MTNREILDALDEFYDTLSDHGLQTAIVVLNNLIDAITACEEDGDEEEDTAVVWAEAQAVEQLNTRLWTVSSLFQSQIADLQERMRGQEKDDGRIAELIAKTADLDRRSAELELATNNLAEHSGKAARRAMELENSLNDTRVTQEKVNQLTDQEIEELQRHAWMSRPDLAKQLKIEEFIPF